VVNALQSQVSRLRRLLAEGGDVVVERHAAGYLLAIDPEDVDAHRFTRLAAEGRRALDADEPAEAAAAPVVARVTGGRGRRSPP